MKTKKIFLLMFLLAFVIGSGFYFWSVVEDSTQTPEEQLFNITLSVDFDEHQIQRFNEQMEILKQMYKEDSDDAEFWIGFGNLCQVAEDYQKAANAYIKAGQIAPFNTISFANLARLYEKRIGDYIKAESYYKQAIKNSPKDVWLFIDLSKMYRNKLNDLEKEESILLEGLELNPDNSNISFILDDFYKRNNK